jgi:hypothetical protein
VARRRRSDPEPSLFSFLSVLKAVMGTLTLIISGMSHLAFANPQQRIELEAFTPGKKTAIHVECRGDGLLLHGEEEGAAPRFVARDEIGRPGGTWSSLRRSLELDAHHYLMFLVRAEGVGTFHEARASLGDAAIDVGYEPLFGTGEVKLRAPEDPR